MHLLIPAAGMGRRMGSPRNKLLLTLRGKPLLAWTILAAMQAEAITWIGIIGQPEDFQDFQEILADIKTIKPLQLIVGGSTRQQSVYNGLEVLPLEAERVLIHDGARCLITPDLFNRCANAIMDCQGLIAAVAVKDTIKQVDYSGLVVKTPDRTHLWAAQTPQAFDAKLLRQCHEKGKQSNWEVTDDAALFELCGLPVRIFQGEDTNLKITTPADLYFAEAILAQREK
jgi:2-C-methyl-D-erythritol 4-phosphate cytidylyltransferase